jgi:hypothetical protein
MLQGVAGSWVICNVPDKDGEKGEETKAVKFRPVKRGFFARGRGVGLSNRLRRYAHSYLG